MLRKHIDAFVLIRDFVFENDYPKVIDLWSKAGKGIHLGVSDEPGEIRKKIARDPDLFLVAETDNEIVGTVMGGFDGRRGMIYHLAVARIHRKHSIGSKLITEIEKRLKAKGCYKAYLLVVKGNEAAKKFYEKRNWELMNVWTLGKVLE
jgi:ribosomal protein S18 acetylase RimI-like enzyme